MTKMHCLSASRQHGAIPRRSRCCTISSWRWRIRASPPSDIYVLDFDGVIVDSENEVTASAIAAASSYWPDIFTNLHKDQEIALRTRMRSARPKLISGYEALAMARLLCRDDDGAILAAILSDWENLFPKLLVDWGEEADSIRNHFEHYRSSAMSVSGGMEWCELSPLYTGVSEALSDCDAPVYFASSKAPQRIIPLIKYHLKIELEHPSPRLFAGLIPPNSGKAEALRQIMERPLSSHPQTALHFVDDRLETLMYIREHHPEVAKRYTLYFATWGYSTPEEKNLVLRLPGIQPLTLPEFCELLRWGLVSNTFDGCEPEEAEKIDTLGWKPPSSV